MLIMHEVHTVRGRAEDEFEAAFRHGWMPVIGADADARLLWYANHAHGSGPAYTVVTMTAVRDGPAFERLALRVQKGRRKVEDRDWTPNIVLGLPVLIPETYVPELPVRLGLYFPLMRAWREWSPGEGVD